jgi:hypothetical protein
VFFYLFFAGAGPWSIDALIRAPLRERRAEVRLPGSIRRQADQGNSSRTL